jgi:hypothetical protein
MDELTDEEANNFMSLIRKLRKVQREVFGIEHVYYFYNEDTTHHSDEVNILKVKEGVKKLAQYFSDTK